MDHNLAMVGNAHYLLVVSGSIRLTLTHNAHHWSRHQLITNGLNTSYSLLVYNTHYLLLVHNSHYLLHVRNIPTFESSVTYITY